VTLALFINVLIIIIIIMLDASYSADDDSSILQPRKWQMIGIG